MPWFYQFSVDFVDRGLAYCCLMMLIVDYGLLLMWQMSSMWEHLILTIIPVLECMSIRP